MEDAMILNKSAVERGLGHATMIKTEQVDLSKESGMHTPVSLLAPFWLLINPVFLVHNALVISHAPAAFFCTCCMCFALWTGLPVSSQMCIPLLTCTHTHSFEYAHCHSYFSTRPSLQCTCVLSSGREFCLLDK